MPELVIVADDLSGAADCGIACVHHGLRTLVTFGETTAAAFDAIAIDADTRSLSRSEAAERTASIVRAAMRHDRQLLYKKLDSTLRGHPAAELAATLHEVRSVRADRTVVILAPAFPAAGRTTIRGHQMLNGTHLNETELGRREQMESPCDVADLMQQAGLSVAVVPLELVRSPSLAKTLQQKASTYDLIVCDAETDADLESVAASSVMLGPGAIWAGSAGLAHHLPRAVGLSRRLCSDPMPQFASSKPILIVIGSTSSVTRNQLSHLSSSTRIATITVAPQTLLEGPGSEAWRHVDTQVAEALQLGRDTAIALDCQNPLATDAGPKLARAMGALLAPYKCDCGALVASGGETARAVLEGWGVSALRLMREVEPGIPISLAEVLGRPLPVVTKAGAFGQPTALSNCLHALRSLT